MMASLNSIPTLNQDMKLEILDVVRNRRDLSHLLVVDKDWNRCVLNSQSLARRIHRVDFDMLPELLLKLLKICGSDVQHLDLVRLCSPFGGKFLYNLDKLKPFIEACPNLKSLVIDITYSRDAVSNKEWVTEMLVPRVHKSVTDIFIIYSPDNPFYYEQEQVFLHRFSRSGWRELTENISLEKYCALPRDHQMTFERMWREISALVRTREGFNFLIASTPEKITERYNHRKPNFFEKFIEAGLTMRHCNVLLKNELTYLRKYSSLLVTLLNEGFSPNHLYRVLENSDAVSFSEYLASEEDKEPFTSLRKLDEDEFPLLGNAAKVLGDHFGDNWNIAVHDLFVRFYEICRFPKPVRQVAFQNILKFLEWDENICPLSDFRNHDPEVVEAIVVKDVLHTLKVILPIWKLMRFEKEYVTRIFSKVNEWKKVHPIVFNVLLPLLTKEVPSLEDQEKVVKLFERDFLEEFEEKVGAGTSNGNGYCTIL
jgi:hypothetical protein